MTLTVQLKNFPGIDKQLLQWCDGCENGCYFTLAHLLHHRLDGRNSKTLLGQDILDETVPLSLFDYPHIQAIELLEKLNNVYQQWDDQLTEKESRKKERQTRNKTERTPEEHAYKLIRHQNSICRNEHHYIEDLIASESRQLRKPHIDQPDKELLGIRRTIKNLPNYAHTLLSTKNEFRHPRERTEWLDKMMKNPDNLQHTESLAGISILDLRAPKQHG